VVETAEAVRAVLGAPIAERRAPAHRERDAL
jgi:hypothetical protein